MFVVISAWWGGLGCFRFGCCRLVLLGWLCVLFLLQSWLLVAMALVVWCLVVVTCCLVLHVGLSGFEVYV